LSKPQGVHGRAQSPKSLSFLIRWRLAHLAV